MALYYPHPFCYPMWKGRHISDIRISDLVTKMMQTRIVSYLTKIFLSKSICQRNALYLNIYLENLPILANLMILTVENYWLFKPHLFQHCRLSGIWIDGRRTVNQHDQNLGRKCHLDKCTIVVGKKTRVDRTENCFGITFKTNFDHFVFIRWFYKDPNISHLYLVTQIAWRFNHYNNKITGTGMALWVNNDRTIGPQMVFPIYSQVPL